MNSGCFKRRDSQPEKMDAAYQQLRHVLGAIQLAAIEHLRMNTELSMDALIRRVTDQRGTDFLRSELDSREYLQIYSDASKWHSQWSNDQEIAVWNPFQFIDTVHKTTNYIAIDFHGKRVDLLKEPTWKPYLNPTRKP